MKRAARSTRVRSRLRKQQTEQCVYNVTFPSDEDGVGATLTRDDTYVGADDEMWQKAAKARVRYIASS